MMSLPASRIASCGRAARVRRTIPGLTSSESSTITTASAPGGIGAPVMIRIASPAFTAIFGSAPAATVSTIRNSTGTSCTSFIRTANPSTAEFANHGTFSDATTSCASTRPVICLQELSTGVKGEQAASTVACASSIGIMDSLRYRHMTGCNHE